MAGFFYLYRVTVQAVCEYADDLPMYAPAIGSPSQSRLPCIELAEAAWQFSPA
jgi:hypothetical protein